MSEDEVRARLLSGSTVHMGFAAGSRVWWFEGPYQEVDDDTMLAAAFGRNGGRLLEEAGDCLFGWEGNSQTWRSAYA